MCMIQEHMVWSLITDLITFLHQHAKASLHLSTEGLASTPGTQQCISEVQGPLQAAPHPSHTPLLFLEASSLHLPKAHQ